MQRPGRCLLSRADADPDSAEAQRNLSVSFNKLGDVSVVAWNIVDSRQ